MKRKFVPMFLSAVATVSCIAWKSQTADFESLWKYEQSVRSVNNDSIRMTKDKFERQKSILNLESLLKEMYTPKFAQVKDSQGYLAFIYQANDIRRDLLDAYCIDNDFANAIRVLKDLRVGLANPPEGPKSDVSHFYLESILESDITAKWVKTPEFVAELDEIRKLDPIRQFRSMPFSTEFKEKIPLNDRIAGVSYIWSEAKYLFANFDLVPNLNWDAEYQVALQAAMKTEKTYDYYKVLRSFIGKLSDSHTDIYLPAKLRERYEVRPLIMTQLIEDQVVVYEDAPESLLSTGLKRGDIIEKIDGVNAFTYGRDRWSFLGNFSTLQDANVRRYSYMLLRGPAGKSVKLTVRKVDGSIATVSVPRETTQKGRILPPSEFKILPNGVAYFAFNTCGNDAPVKNFRSHLDEIKKAKGLIIDVRRNGGGNSDIGYQILSHLISKPVPSNVWETPQYRASFFPWGHKQEKFTGESGFLVPNKSQISVKTVVLAGAMTFSAAEDFASMVKMSKKIKIIGTPSGGSTGQPKMFSLPGGGGGRICTKRDRMADGTEFVGKGVQPDILVTETVKSIQEGRDLVLERAISEVLDQ